MPQTYSTASTARASTPRFSWLDGVVFAVALGSVAFIGYRLEDVLNYHWHWSRVAAYLVRWDEQRGTWIANLLLQGFFMTLRLALWGILWAALLGLVMGIFRTSRLLLPRLAAFLYVALVRNTPPLVFIFIFYFFISGQLVAMLPYHDGGRLQVVERGHQDFVADAVRDSSGIRDRLRKVAWPLRR